MPTEDGGHGWPRFLAPMRELLEKVRPPDGPFNAPGSWEHRYLVCRLQPERGAQGEHPRPYGQLVLNRKPASNGQVSLSVDLSVTMAGSTLRTSAQLTCAADRLGTPKKWELRSGLVKESAVVEGGTLIRRGQIERRTALAGPFTSNWSLMEAVQRLPFEDFPPLNFVMLEDMDLQKPGQVLRPAGTVSVEWAGGPVRLHVFRQVGRGILPAHYWVDDQHRLLAVTGGVRGFVLDGRA